MNQSEQTSFESAPRRQTMYDAGFAAQQLAFAPVNFMISICMQRMGVWDAMLKELVGGMTADEVAESCKISLYAAKVLLESSMAIGSVRREGERFYMTKLGHVLAKDQMTRVNFDFIYDVCFKGLFHLEEALRTGAPSGLKELGQWPTIYEGLKDLPGRAKDAWFAFDHFYSDSAFRNAMSVIFSTPVGSLLDIGGNTGRFATEVLQFNKEVQVTIADLPPQIEVARTNLTTLGLKDRVHFHTVNLLNNDSTLPQGFDVVWMSQFLVCFSEDEIATILKKAKASLKEHGRILILDTFWDRQENHASTYCLIQTSPYFTAMANGNSKMYDAATIQRIAAAAGLTVNAIHDSIGLSHSLMELQASNHH